MCKEFNIISQIMQMAEFIFCKQNLLKPVPQLSMLFTSTRMLIFRYWNIQQFIFKWMLSPISSSNIMVLVNTINIKTEF